MKKKIKYEDAPEEIEAALKKAKIVEDFLPPPQELVLKENTVRITINLKQKSVDFFKHQSKELGIPYQKMIKKILDVYSEKYAK